MFSIVVMSSKYVGSFGHRSNLVMSIKQVFLRFTDSSKPRQFINVNLNGKFVIAIWGIVHTYTVFAVYTPEPA